MSLAAQIVDQRVVRLVGDLEDKLVKELRCGSDTNRKKSASFVFLVAKTVLGLSDDEAFDGVVDGGNDFGIDAIYFNSPVDGEISISIIQGKYKQNVNGDFHFPENGIEKIIDAIGALFDPGRPLTLNDRLSARIEDVRSFVAAGAIPRVVVIATSNGVKWNSITEDRISASSNDFGDQVEWRYIGPEEILRLLQAQRPIDATIQLVGSAMVEPFDFRRVLIGRMSVMELAQLIDQFEDRLLERNIRRYLGLAGNRVNEAVAATLREESQRNNFYFYNNGITLICSQFRHNALQKDNWKVQVNELQIVNGGQTSRTVHQVSKELGPALASAHVLVRIYELPQDDDDLVGAITYATNSQNPVDLRDLKANDEKQKILSESIRGLGYEYRTKRDFTSTTSDEFTSAVVAEAVLAIWRHRPHQARFAGAKHFGALYDIIYTKDLNGAQAVIAALVLRLAENRRKRPPQGAPEFLAYGSRFVAMMVGVYLLKDLNIKLEDLSHVNFLDAKKMLDKNSTSYLEQAEADIEEKLVPLLSGRDRTLQRLSATFRRADLIESLTGEALTANPEA